MDTNVLNALIALAAVIVTPTLTFIYALRHDRDRWHRETRWTVYVEILEWAVERRRAFEGGPAETHIDAAADESTMIAKALAGASQHVIDRLQEFIEATPPGSGEGERSHSAAANTAWYELTQQIRSELGSARRFRSRFKRLGVRSRAVPGVRQEESSSQDVNRAPSM